MGNRANKPQKPPSKASKPSGVKNEARAATKAQGTAESVDLELRNRPLKPSAERPKMVEESTPSPQPAVPESPKPKDKKGKTNTGSAEVLVKPKKSSNNSIKAKKLSTENKSAGKSSKSTKKPKKKEPATDLAESSIQTAQSQKEQKSSKDNNKSKRSTGATKSSTSGSGAKAAPHQDLTKVLANGFCDATLKKGVTGLRQEYARVKGETVPAAEKFIAFVENHPSGRNRYRDVPCIDETRVKLKNHPQGYDYIHANYVTTPFSDKRFICSQAPLDTTCFDFWLMVLQEESEHVIMLCNFIETGKEKCAQYIPMEVGGSLVFQDITITVLSMDVLKTEAMTLRERVCQRGIKIQKGDSERKIAHHHFESWRSGLGKHTEH